MFISYLEELMNSELDVIAKFQQNFMITPKKKKIIWMWNSLQHHVNVLIDLLHNWKNSLKYLAHIKHWNSCDYGNT